MSRTVTVEVTAEDISRGNKGNCFACPIALALDRACAASGFVYAGPNRLAVKDIGACRLPQEAANFMFDFDNGNPVHPLSFTVELT